MAADGREVTRVLSMQTDGQLKSIREGGFSLRHHRKIRFPSFTAEMFGQLTRGSAAYFSRDLGMLGMLFSSPRAKGPVAASTSRLNKSSWSRSDSLASRSFRMVAPRRK